MISVQIVSRVPVPSGVPHASGVSVSVLTLSHHPAQTHQLSSSTVAKAAMLRQKIYECARVFVTLLSRDYLHGLGILICSRASG